MTKYGFALMHGIPSILGIWRLLLRNPGFAARLFKSRLHYFRTRALDSPFLTPEGCFIDTPDMLVSYWCMFIERELVDSRWTAVLKEADRPLVVDVGANAGIFSLLAHTMNHQAEIIAFEPLPAMQARLRQMKDRSSLNMTLYDKAVSNTIGRARFESPHGYDGISRMAVDQQAGVGTFEVETTTLDTVLAGRQVLLIKIDVEGFECEVLAGAGETMKRTRFMIVEAQTPEHVAKVTRAAGPGWQQKHLGAGDLLFYR